MLFLFTLEFFYLTLEWDFDQMFLKLNDINKAKISDRRNSTQSSILT